MKKYTSALVAVFAVAMMLTASAQAQTVELFGNNDFESALAPNDQSPFGNWSGFAGVASGAAPAAPSIGTTNPFAGAQHLVAAITGEDNAFAGIQQQTNVTAGDSYTFSFYAASDGNPFGVIGEYRIEWFDAAGGNLGSTGNQIIDSNNLTSGYQLFEFQNQIAPPTATLGRGVIALQSFGGATNEGTLFVDNTSFVGPKQIPEPTTAGLLALGLVGLVARRRR